MTDDILAIVFTAATALLDAHQAARSVCDPDNTTVGEGSVDSATDLRARRRALDFS
jgi:hypothetical protein